MFQFKTDRPNRSAMSRVIKLAIPALALAGNLAVAGPGHASQFFLQKASMNTSRIGYIGGPGTNEYTYMAPVKFTTFLGTGATPHTGAMSSGFDMVGFCVDIFHNISLGTINLKYDTKYNLTTNSKYLTGTPFVGGTPLSNTQKLQVARLVNYGTLIYNSSGAVTSDKLNRMSAVQGAIWKVVNPSYNVYSIWNSTAINTAVNSYINTYSSANYYASLTGYGQVHGKVKFISETGKYGTNAAHQSFAIAEVPEPATWAIMILGFGLTGAMLRRSRKRMALATAAI